MGFGARGGQMPIWTSIPGSFDRRSKRLSSIRNTHRVFRDFIGVADFSKPSRTPRFHVVSTHGRQRTAQYLVAPWQKGPSPLRIQVTSSVSPSEASLEMRLPPELIERALFYMGARWALPMRLEGLDFSNSNALSRAIVVPGAWYVNNRVCRAIGNARSEPRLFRRRRCQLAGNHGAPRTRPSDLRRKQGIGDGAG